MTGAELKAWRVRLGKDEAWADRVLGAVYLPVLGTGYGDCRRPVIEKMSRAGEYGLEQTTALLTAYAAALKAEEARQAAERAQAEPVCPEGVYTTERHDPSRGPETVIRWSSEETELFVGYRETEDDVKAARFYLELVTYRARQHAEGDRQRKLDAVRAAEKVQQDALNALSLATRARFSAEDAHKAAQDTLARAGESLRAARREAGL